MKTQKQQWEFCKLVLNGIKVHKPKILREGGCTYNCYIIYMGQPEVEFLQLANIEDKDFMNFNPFYRAMRLLGEAEWELISVQHGSNMGGCVLDDNVIAFFKRLCRDNRAAHEPWINISEDKVKQA